VLSDLDGDGRLEVIVKNRTAPQIRVFHNDLNPIGESVAFSLRSTKSDRDAIGVVVELIGEHGRQRKTLRAGSGFLSQNTRLLYFGVGITKGPLRAVIAWPNGVTQTLENIPVGHRVEVQENAADFHATPCLCNSRPPWRCGLATRKRGTCQASRCLSRAMPARPSRS
jgi:hypothetical protein